MTKMAYNKTNPCPSCRHPEFEVGVAGDGRPDFLCTNCGHSWTYGDRGGGYLKNAKKIWNVGPKEWDPGISHSSGKR